MSKLDFQDVTVIIPFKKEVPERFNNLKLIIEFLRFHYDIHILIGEMDDTPKVDKYAKNNDIDYLFYKYDGVGFYKTRLINQLLHKVKTNIVFLHDSDILVHPNDVLYGIQNIRENIFGYYLPFNQKFYKLPKNYHLKKFSKSFNIKILKQSVEYDKLKFKCVRDSVGGCLIYRKRQYFDLGWENENITTYIADDRERWHRIRKLGYKIHIGNYPLYHLYHPNTIRYSNELVNDIHKSKHEAYKVISMNYSELRNYVNSWELKRNNIVVTRIDKNTNINSLFNLIESLFKYLNIKSLVIYYDDLESAKIRQFYKYKNVYLKQSDNKKIKDCLLQCSELGNNVLWINSELSYKDSFTYIFNYINNNGVFIMMNSRGKIDNRIFGYSYYNKSYLNLLDSKYINENVPYYMSKYFVN